MIDWSRLKVARPDSLNLLALLSKEGIQAMGVDHYHVPFLLPVALVDSEITLPVSVGSPTLGAPATAGTQVAPAAATVLADTGAQPAGAAAWFFFMSVANSNQAADLGNFEIARRNAANNADVWVAQIAAECGVNLLRITLVLNERIVIRNHAAGGAGSAYQASIWGPF